MGKKACVREGSSFNPANLFWELQVSALASSPTDIMLEDSCPSGKIHNKDARTEQREGKK
jgi:hypothetical protein